MATSQPPAVFQSCLRDIILALLPDMCPSTRIQPEKTNAPPRARSSDPSKTRRLPPVYDPVELTRALPKTPLVLVICERKSVE